MNRFSIANSLKLARFELKNSRRQISGWCLAIFALMFLYMILFPSIQGVMQMKLDAMPKAMLQAFGMESFNDFGNFISYFGVVYNLILIAISIFAATFSANLICKEEKFKTIEFLYSLEVSRLEIYVAKLITAFVAVLLIICSAGVSTMICGFINAGPTFVLVDFLKIIKISSFTVFFFVGVAFLFAGISSNIGASALGSVTVLVCYLLGFLSTLLGDSGAWLEKLSPFQLFSPQNALAFETDTFIALLVYFALMLIFVVVGGISYKRRDFKV